MCVQYRAGGGVGGVVFSTVRDIMSNVVGYLEYCGRYHDKCGRYLEYHGGYHEYHGGILSTVMETKYSGGYHEYCGVFSTVEGYHLF